MSRVIVGYDECKGFLLTEVSSEFLAALGLRYPLRGDDEFSPDCDALLITVAVHAELARRKAGGEQTPQIPTLREVAQEIITKGFHQISPGELRRGRHS
jgi:hypothetical protein